MHKVKNDEGDWIQGDDEIAGVVCKYFQGIFTRTAEHVPKEMLSNIPKMISNDQNKILYVILY